MRLAVLLAFAALASAAHAQTQPCRKRVFERTGCATAPAPSAPAPSAPALARPARPAPAAAAPAAEAAPRPLPALTTQQELDPRLVAPFDCNFAQSFTLGPAVCQARKAAAAHRRVGELVGAGRCAEAVAAARRTGDLAFAGRVQAYCVERRR